MATIVNGANNRTDVSSRETVSASLQQAKFSRFEVLSGSAHGVDSILRFTGSLTPPAGFIIESAGNSVISALDGGNIAASVLNTKTLYEVSVSSVSGSGHIHFVY